MHHHPLPVRVRALVLGGGIHGVGVLHDLASRGWRDIHLIEKATLGYGTSSKTTKLIHGGLRYLRRMHDFGLVSESLKERHMLQELASDLIHPIELYFPILKEGGISRHVLKCGLTLYDFFAGKQKIKNHRIVPNEEVRANAPIIDMSKFRNFFSFWDTQTDDLALVRRIADSAVKMGASITEGCQAKSIWPCDDGWIVEVTMQNGSTQRISALYVINCLGSWSHQFLESSNVTPTHRAINNKGVHIIVDDLGLKRGLFLQSGTDDRIVFMLPWQRKTLIGTTEDLYDGDLDRINISEKEVNYLLENCNRYLVNPIKEKDILASFAGLRWLAVEKGKSLSTISRAYTVGEKAGGRGLLLSVYGGKLTTYRTLSKTIGDRITTHFGEFRPSMTHLKKSWATAETSKIDLPDPIERYSVR